MNKSLASLFGHEKITLLNTPSDDLVLPDCVMGIEIEVEGAVQADATLFERVRSNNESHSSGYQLRDRGRSMYWNLVKDGSLREGIEFVTPQVFGKDIIQALNVLSYVHSEMKQFPPRFSYRCSTHVHMDVRDLDRDRFLSLVIIYLMYERYLFDFWGQNRYKNIYCIPINNCYTLMRPLLTLGKESNEAIIRDILSSFSEGNRYCALNVAALIKYGSIEFRHGHGTFDQEKLLNWINVLQCLKRYALSTDVEQLLSLITGKAFVDLSHDVFGHMYNVILGDVDIMRLKKELYATKRRLKSLLIAPDAKRVKEKHDWTTNELFDNFLDHQSAGTKAEYNEYISVARMMGNRAEARMRIWDNPPNPESEPELAPEEIMTDEEMEIAQSEMERELAVRQARARLDASRIRVQNQFFTAQTSNTINTGGVTLNMATPRPPRDNF